ncbi:SDR family NAD(P)-dependent oxidoreductase [Nocardioides zeae]|uniref:SDR family oxidoreductase n=1 Tax=Nocardioides zeae TaxID=1457234 RepID=A0A6P0HJY7_9ACTN|nr:SDR family oxidoreductase [Nocardioides zeae]
MRELEGRTAFVTGGASGIGLAVAAALLDEGMAVAVADHSEANLADAERVLGIAGRSGTLALHRLDVTDRVAFAAVADRVEEHLGGIDLLVNNAGIGLAAPMSTAGYDDWDRMLAVNLGGVVNGVVTVVPRIRRHGRGGHVVNTASMAGLIPMLDAGGIYTTTKFAVRGLSASLRLALAPERIGVTCLCPGLTRTRILDAVGGAGADDATAFDAAQDPVNAEFAQAQESAMDPAVLAACVVDAVRANDAYVIAHAEFVDELDALHAEVLDAVRHDVPVAPGRLVVEQRRRALVDGVKSSIAAG